MMGLKELADAILGLTKSLEMRLGHVTTMVERSISEQKKYGNQVRAVGNVQNAIQETEANNGKTLDVVGLYGKPAIAVTLVDLGGATAVTWGANGEQPFAASLKDSLDNETIGTLHVKATSATGPVRVRFAFGPW